MGGSELTILFPLAFEEVEVVDELVEETWSVLFVVAECTKENEEAEATLAGHTRAGGYVLAGLLFDVELDPFATVGMDGAGNELVLCEVTQTVALTWLEDNAWRANELGHNDTLGAVDHEGAAVGHHREVTHEDRLLFDLACVRVHEPGAHENRRAIGHVLLFALLDRMLRRWAQIFIVWIKLEFELKRF